MNITTEQIEDWLVQKQITLWADWDISEPDRRALAAEWFAHQIQLLERHVERRRSAEITLDRAGLNPTPWPDPQGWPVVATTRSGWFGMIRVDL
jgi:hypothetical protein